MNFSKLVSHWLPDQSAPSAIYPVVQALRKIGIEVCRVGMDNPKAPIYYFFVNHPFDVHAVLAELHDTAGLSADYSGSGINSIEYVWIGFEGGVCASA